MDDEFDDVLLLELLFELLFNFWCYFVSGFIVKVGIILSGIVVIEVKVVLGGLLSLILYVFVFDFRFFVFWINVFFRIFNNL